MPLNNRDERTPLPRRAPLWCACFCWLWMCVAPLFSVGQAMKGVIWYNTDYLLPEREINNLVFDAHEIGWVAGRSSIYLFNGSCFRDMKYFLEDRRALDGALDFSVNYLSSSKQLFFACSKGLYEVLPSVKIQGKLQLRLLQPLPQYDIRKSCWQSAQFVYWGRQFHSIDVLRLQTQTIADMHGMCWVTPTGQLIAGNRDSSFLMLIQHRGKLQATVSYRNPQDTATVFYARWTFSNKYVVPSRRMALAFGYTDLNEDLKIYDATKKLMLALREWQLRGINTPQMEGVRGYCKDASGRLWIATDQGLVTTDPMSELIRQTAVSGSSRSIVHNRVNDDCAVSFYNGLYLLNRTGKLVTQWKDSTAIFKIGFLLNDSTGVFLNTLRNSKMVAVHFGQRRMEELRLPDHFNNGPGLHAVRVNDSSFLLFGGMTTQIVLSSGKLRVQKTYPAKLNDIKLVIRLDSQRLLLGCTSGVWLFDQRTWGYQQLNNLVVTSMLVHQQEVYFSTASGDLYVMNQRRVLRHLFSGQQMGLFQAVYQLTADPRRPLLWLGTDNGLYIYDITTNHVRKGLRVEDGLNANEFNGYSSGMGRDGSLWFGGLGGVNYFKPAQVLQKGNIQASFLQVLNSTGVADYYLLTGLSRIQLPSDKNNVRIYYSYKGFGKSYFRYSVSKLLKMPIDWQIAKEDNAISLYNLQYGQQMLRIETDAFVGDSKLGRSILTIMVVHPWYLKWYVVLAGFLLLLGIVYVVIAWRISLVKQAAAIRLKNSREDFFRIVAHDLRSPIKAYQGVSQSIGYLIQTGQIHRLPAVAQHIDQLGKSLDTLVSNLLSWTYAERNGTVAHMGICDVQHMLQELLESYQSFGADHDWQLHMEEAVGKAAMTDGQYLHLALRNLLDNAMKHGERGSRIEVALFCAKPGWYSIMVSNKVQAAQAARLKEIQVLLADASYKPEPGKDGLNIGMVMIAISMKVLGARYQLLIEEERFGFLFSFQDILPEKGAGNAGSQQLTFF